jgi:TonB family protein
MEHAMLQTDLMPKQRKDPSLVRHAGAFGVSCVFHATFFGLLLWVTLVYRAKWMPPPSSSQASAPSITLSTLVITPAPTPPPPSPPKPKTPIVATTPADMIPKAPQPRPAPVENAMPVLTAQPPKTVAVTQTKTAPTHPARAPATHLAKASPAKPKPAASASFASSYAPGENVLPHPPYPENALDMHETGTVVMLVTFNTAGKVTQAKVSQSSGVWQLDMNTRSFILTHWHSTLFAGQTVTQPVHYHLEQ